MLKMEAVSTNKSTIVGSDGKYPYTKQKGNVCY